MSDVNGFIFDIQRFSVHDGPGIRTTIFFKGCSNSCGWCHNPESIVHDPQIQYYKNRCINCGKCVNACPYGCHLIVDGLHVFNRENCEKCGLCVKVCHSNALMLSGKSVTVEYVMNEILADIEYYRQSNGGVTLSGGEPVLQYRFCKEILKRCKDIGLHTIIQTAGNYDYACLKGLLPFTDLVMYDIKAYSERIYNRHIHGDKDTIFGNLTRLSSENLPIIVRTPVIGGVNDDEREIQLIVEHLQRLKNINNYILLPYHDLADVKYEALGLSRDHNYFTPDTTQIEALREMVLKGDK